MNDALKIMELEEKIDRLSNNNKLMLEAIMALSAQLDSIQNMQRETLNNLSKQSQPKSIENADTHVSVFKNR